MNDSSLPLVLEPVTTGNTGSALLQAALTTENLRRAFKRVRANKGAAGVDGLNSGIMDGGVVRSRDEGTPQGGPLSPLLANVMLDEVDKELERRGHCFARYADDANVYVRSKKAGERVMALLRRLYAKLLLKVNESKSAVGSAFGRKFLGYSLWVLAPRVGCSRISTVT